MSEYRQDMATGEWAIIAPERCQVTPTVAERNANAPLLVRDSLCPFCPGNERMLPPITVQTPGAANTGWINRVVPNLYPAVSSRGFELTDSGISTFRAGTGLHEVIIDSPRHDLDLACFEEEALIALIETYRDRFVHAADHAGIRSVLGFRNRGRAAGASQNHPHSQIIATSLIPPRVARIDHWGRKWRDSTGRCPTCESLAADLRDRSRIVEETHGFIALVPFAASTPFEVRVIPARHEASFAVGVGNAVPELAGLLRRTLERLERTLGSMSYNMTIDSGLPAFVDAPSYHWHMRILPATRQSGGFELAAGMPINPSLPERNAEVLRDALTGGPA